MPSRSTAPQSPIGAGPTHASILVPSRKRTLVWLLGFRRLGVRYERRADLLLAFLNLVCALVALRFLRPPGPVEGAGRLR
jgi:hypothetical protein